jgi:hypothetical protein
MKSLVMPTGPKNVFINDFITHSAGRVRSSDLSHCTYWSFVLRHAIKREQVDVSGQFHARVALPPLKENYLFHYRELNLVFQ